MDTGVEEVEDLGERNERLQSRYHGSTLATPQDVNKVTHVE